MIGVKTHVITSVEATPTESNDAAQFAGLAERTAKTFEVAEVSADKAYSTRKNFHAVDALGATLYSPFKSNTTGMGHEFDPLWNKMWGSYQFHRDDLLEHYRKRSNAESAVGMLKAKFGTNARSKSPVAQVNEVLCKVLAHSICVLIAPIYELDLAPTFWADGAVAQKVA